MSFFMEGMGLMRLTQLPQGHTNSVAEFQQCTQHMISPMYPERAEVFIDDCAIKGPRSRYNENTIPENAQIREFVCLGICSKHSRVASKSVGKWSHDFWSQNGFGNSMNAIAGSRSSSRWSSCIT